MFKLVGNNIPRDNFKILNQKMPHVCTLPDRGSRAGNGCANYMGAWDFVALSAENLHAHKIPHGDLGRFGGEMPILFLWVRGFFLTKTSPRQEKP